MHTGSPGPNSGGVSYIRWGRTTCPNTQATGLVYQGVAAGSGFLEAGSTDYHCLHAQPEFLSTTAGLQDVRGRLYGTEYDSYGDPPAFGSQLRHEAPCSVCYSSARSTKITIAGRITCPATWTREYYGYLMSSAHHTNRWSRSSACVDVNAESVPGSSSANIKSLFVFMEFTCTGINCPPYSDGAEASCVVCTK